ncbi:uncharacterized protein LOC131210202 isoform X1 [Anopheles bellator]|uniref:uncharacterized protein LOC131210202 isoform X1 n=1 Tax=Anopheles bellator TaxID=139047 RepID=UPI00264797B7|nr:uncharacterized protein LOC131210202 isoform X1 [Anopheles bellator]
MASMISLLAVGLMVIGACVDAQQYHLGSRRLQDRPNLLRSHADGDGYSRNDLYTNQQQQQQRYGDRHQHHNLQDEQDRRGDYDHEDYSYGYAVRDEHSGDIKSQQEVRHGDRVRGQYRTLESDGTERIVDYTADDHRGFNAVVRHQPSVGTRAQLVHTLQPAVLLRNPTVGQLIASGQSQPLFNANPNAARGPTASVLLHQ